MQELDFDAPASAPRNDDPRDHDIEVRVGHDLYCPHTDVVRLRDGIEGCDVNAITLAETVRSLDEITDEIAALRSTCEAQSKAYYDEQVYAANLFSGAAA